jgi:hypothetical protein
VSVASNRRVRRTRNLKCRTPTVHVDRCHSERPLWFLCPAALDPRKLRGPIDRSVSQPKRSFFHLGQPLQRVAFVPRPASEVEHHIDVHSEKLKSEADHQAFEYLPLGIGSGSSNKRDHPLVRSQAQCVLLPRKFLATMVLPDPGRPTGKIIIAMC